MSNKTTYFWFRRDLRLDDNHGLYQALKNHKNVQPIFIFDTQILDKLEDKEDARVTFLHNTLTGIDQELAKVNSGLLVKYGNPIQIWEEILASDNTAAIYCNKDYEPYARERDETVKDLTKSKEVIFESYKDHVIFEEREVVKKDGNPYTVFTPYSKVWKKQLAENEAIILAHYDCSTYISHWAKRNPNQTIIALEQMGFSPNTTIEVPTATVTQKLVKNYDQTRNFPAIAGTSRLGLHFRFGTISIRQKAKKAKKLNETFLNELIWRDFYAMILANFPEVVGNSFREKYEGIQWRNNKDEFEKWKAGQTGYPMVDAGMRELNNTGYMHNRVRMVVASFLCKHLLIDWRWGEAYFAEKLLDFDLASNNGGWQWAAGCGTDAAPYFRIFNPESQLKKFDKDHKYIKKWIPEFGTNNYVAPVVEHKMARERCLERYKAGING
jgi:deoxyribodipyrimidine photo-lyase